MPYLSACATAQPETHEIFCLGTFDRISSHGKPRLMTASDKPKIVIARLRGCCLELYVFAGLNPDGSCPPAKVGNFGDLKLC